MGAAAGGVIAGQKGGIFFVNLFSVMSPVPLPAGPVAAARGLAFCQISDSLGKGGAIVIRSGKILWLFRPAGLWPSARPD